MRSFDVFDTIIARRFIRNDVLLSKLEQIYSIPNFAVERKRSDDGTKSLDSIYLDLVRREIISAELADKIKNHELILERESSFLIKENSQKIQDGDILISDMYIPGPDILDWIRSLGMDKQVTIYQSNSDKSSGVVWEKLKDIDLECHLGDNEHSDIEVPKSFGINTILYSESIKPTQRELLIKNQGLHAISNLIRELRLTNTSIVRESYETNIPWLFIICELLHRKYKNEKLAFLGRDCQLLYKIYNAYYDLCYYIPFSRKAAFQTLSQSLEYLKTQIPINTRLIDIVSTGKTWEVVCAHHPFNITVVFYSPQYSYAAKKPQIPNTFSFLADVVPDIGVSLSLSVEYLNCGDHGFVSAIRTHNGIPFVEFGHKAFSDELIHRIQKPILDATKLANHYKDLIREELSSLSDESLYNLFKFYSKEILTIDVFKFEEFEPYKIKEDFYLMEVAENVKNHS